MEKYSIYSFTIVRSTMEGFVDRLPYCAVLLQDSGGKIFPAILDGVKDDAGLSIGMPVVRVSAENEPAKYCLA